MSNARTTLEIESALHAAYCSADAATSWLSSRPVIKSGVSGVPLTPNESHLTEYVLLRRRDPAIDVALALHGRSQTVLRRLHDRAGSALRALLAGNASLFVGRHHGARLPLRERGDAPNLLWDIVRHGTPSELRAVCTISDLTSGYYQALVGAWRPDRTENKVDETRFKEIVRHLADNPRLAIPREESVERHYLDGFADYEYVALHVSAWGLAAEVPATPEWGAILAALFRNLHRPFDCLDDVDAVLARWTVGADLELHRELRRHVAAAFVKPTIEELRHPDPARRDAFLAKFDPASTAFRDLEWDEFGRLDRYWEFAVWDNMKVWASPDARSRFRAQLWAASSKDNDVVAIGRFDERVEELERTHPEWFATSDHDPETPPPSPVDGIELLRGDVHRLIEALTSRGRSYATGGALFAAGLILGHWI